MKISAILIILFLFQSSEVFSQPARVLTPYRQGDKWGYKLETGLVVIEPQFVQAKEFNEQGIALVYDAIGWAYINVLGNTVIRPVLIENAPEEFSSELCRFYQSRRFGFFDKWGRIVVPAQYEFALPFKEGMAAVCEGGKVVYDGKKYTCQGGKWGYINAKNEVVVKPKYDEATDFENGKAKVRDGSEWFTARKDGKILNK